jgi:hypothetical protein
MIKRFQNIQIIQSGIKIITIFKEEMQLIFDKNQQ